MKSIIATCFTAIFLVSGTCWACSCIAPPPPKKALSQSAAVFSGKVTGIVRNERTFTVTFAIDSTWKGTKGKEVEVKTALNSAACGVNFQMGKSYLVYCYRPKVDRKPDASLHTNICTRTATLAAAKADLKELGKGKKP